MSTNPPKALWNKIRKQPIQEIKEPMGVEIDSAGEQLPRGDESVICTGVHPLKYDRPLDEFDHALLELVHSLTRAGRYRSALDEIFPILELAPYDQWTLHLAASVVYLAQNRYHAYEATEPLADEYILDARLDPIFCECDRCHSTWVPMPMASMYKEIGDTNPLGQRCPECNKVFCRNCLEKHRFAMGMALYACPECGGGVTAIKKATGRRTRQTGRRRERLEFVMVLREGPVPPDGEYLENLFRKVSPEVLVDRPQITGIPVFPWPEDHGDLQARAMMQLFKRGILPAPDQISFYFSGHPDAEGNHWCIVKMYGTTPSDDDILHKADLQSLEGLIARPPRSAGVREALAARYLAEGRYDAAIEQIRAALELDPSVERHRIVSPEVLEHFQYATRLMERSSRLLQMKEFEAARSICQQLVEVAPNWSAAWNNLGLCDFYLGFFARAEERLKRAITLKSDYPPTHCNIGLVHLVRGDYLAAIECEEKALDLLPEYPEARKNLQDANRLREKVIRHRKKHKGVGDPVMEEWLTFRGSAGRTGATEYGPCLPLRPYWQFECDRVDSSPAVGYGRVYFGTESGNLYCIDAISRKEYWQFTGEGSIISSPALDNGCVYFGSEDGHLYCLDAVSGERRWQFSTEDGVKSSPAVLEGQVYVGSLDSHVYCLSVDGNLQWKFKSGSSVLSSPTVGPYGVYVSSWDGKLYCISKDTGLPTWAFDKGRDTGNILAVTPALDDSSVYIAGVFRSADRLEGRVFCLESRTGDVSWSYKWPTEEPGFQSSPAIADGVVYIGGLDGVFLGIADGFRIWMADPRLSFQWWIMSSPTIVGDYMYLSVNDGMLYCFDRATGEAVWSFRVDPEGQGASSSPAIAYNRLYIGTSNAGLLCFGEDIENWIG